MIDVDVAAPAGQENTAAVGMVLLCVDVTVGAWLVTKTSRTPVTLTDTPTFK